MNDEIKEILEQLEWYKKIGKKDVYYPECVLPNKKAFILLDYITNLQQDNTMYAQLKDEYEEEIKDLQQENQEMKTNTIPTLKHNIDALVDEVDELEDYKSRCEKAIEYIENNTHYYSTTKHGEGFVIDNENEEEFCNDLLNILQNGSEE